MQGLSRRLGSGMYDRTLRVLEKAFVRAKNPCSIPSAFSDFAAGEVFGSDQDGLAVWSVSAMDIHLRPASYTVLSLQSWRYETASILR